MMMDSTRSTVQNNQRIQKPSEIRNIEKIFTWKFLYELNALHSYRTAGIFEELRVMTPCSLVGWQYHLLPPSSGSKFCSVFRHSYFADGGSRFPGNDGNHYSLYDVTICIINLYNLYLNSDTQRLPGSGGGLLESPKRQGR